MRISSIRRTPLYVPYSKPYFWAHGTISGAQVVLVEIETDAGVTGYGECIGSPSLEATCLSIDSVADLLLGHDPFENAGLMAAAYERVFQAFGTGSSPRFAARILAGLEMALWDIMGKATDRAVHELLGGAVRAWIPYFGFAQGPTAADVAADAARLAADGFEVIYIKVGRGDDIDVETARAVRAAIGPGHRLRVDANEHWSVLQAARMIHKLASCDVEVVEQPTPCESIPALSQVRRHSPIPISADQSVFNAFDVYDVCRAAAADLIVLGLHETGGILRFLKAASVAEAAGINVCLHGLYETGVTTCAANQAAATVHNLDDANQHMTRFLAWDIVKTPDLRPVGGRLPVLNGPGLGFEIDWDGVDRARVGSGWRSPDGG
jgi:L-alanine-DL-glutamate epimerase-like enolase superfamily enzyme